VFTGEHRTCGAAWASMESRPSAKCEHRRAAFLCPAPGLASHISRSGDFHRAPVDHRTRRPSHQRRLRHPAVGQAWTLGPGQPPGHPALGHFVAPLDLRRWCRWCSTASGRPHLQLRPGDPGPSGSGHYYTNRCQGKSFVAGGEQTRASTLHIRLDIAGVNSHTQSPAPSPGGP